MDDALRQAKLATLIEIEGYDSVEEMMEAARPRAMPTTFASVVRSRERIAGCPCGTARSEIGALR
jgi:hypothetical protein